MIHLRYMTVMDVPHVVAIDRESFTMPWSARSYAYEVSQSSYSYMLVVENEQTIALNGLRRLLYGIRGRPAQETRRHLVAYGGLWNIMDEAHISTIATHPEWRGQGYGEIALVAMLRRSITLKAGYIVLEVRVSNHVAQNLYRKYGFEVVNTKTGYYQDDNEDAYDMRLDLTAPGVQTRIEARYKVLQKRFAFIDEYSAQPRPTQKY